MEKIDIDLNSLFHLSYNFENLKLLLTTISKNQDIFETKIKQIENKLNNIDTNPPKEIPKDKTESKLDISNMRITRDSQKFKTRRETKSTNEDFNRKIFELEDKIRLLYNFIPKFPEDKTRTLNNILDEQQMSINNNNTDIQEMKDKVEKMKGTVDELSIKINDIDIYDIVKDIQFSGGDIEASKILIQSLERKTEARFKFLEEKVKDDEQMAQKLKNEITNLNNNLILQKNSFTIMREQIIKMQNEIDSNKRNTLERIENNENEIENIKERETKNLESINNQFQNLTMNVYDLSNNKNEGNNNLNTIKEDPKEEKKDEESVTKKSEKTNKKETKDNLSDTEKDKSEERDKMDNSTQKLDDANAISKTDFEEYKKDTQKKMNNFERRIQALNAQIKNDYFQKEINALKGEINKRKPTPQEFYDLSVQVQQYTDLYDNMKEENGNMQEEFKKIKDNVSTLLKNYENVILSNASKKMGNNNVEDLTDKDRITILSKFNDFVEITVFNEYIKEQTKFSEKIKKDIDSYRHFYDEIIETLKKAASVQDLKSLEEYLLDLFDEFKEKANKFYPKKSEINKNFKALELQIKQLYEYISKKDENSENWLLAKKPIGGFSCASCESYLGDLKENNEKVLWNQLPEREILSTNTNRIGNGFSRILNLVNVSKDNNITNRKDNNNVNVTLKPDYGGLNSELFLQKKSNELDEGNNFSENKKYMNITMVKNGDEQKNIFRDFSGNNTKTNFTSKQKISFSQEDKFRLTTSDNMNLLKEMKNKKFKKGLPPINKDDSNVKDINFSSLFEEMKDGKEKQTIPKVMKIVRKKNK